MKKKNNMGFKDKILKYFSTNILFLLFVIISFLMSFIMKAVTIGFPIHFKSFLGDIAALLFIGSFSYLIKPKRRYIYFLPWMIFFVLLTIGNTIYYQFYQSFLSINLIATAAMVTDVKWAAYDKVKTWHFFYVFGLIIFIFINKYLKKRKYFDKFDNNENDKKSFTYTLLISIIMLIYLTFTVPSIDTIRLQKQWNREYIVQRYGLYLYHTNDIIQSIQPRLNEYYGYDEASLKFRNYYACKYERKKEVNEYTDYFKGKNVLFIHAESIQNFLVDLKINGKYVTPNLNKLVHEGMYFSKFYPQISVGTSSDTEFTLNTGLLPSSSGTVFVNYYDRKYYSMPQYFHNMGYYTFSAHANYAEYWNRKVVHKVLGYQDFYSKEYYSVPEDTSDMEWVGLGLSDKSFFKQLTPIIKNIKESRSPFMGTVITLSNHSPFGDLTKYGEFEVTMDYEYINDDGKKESGVSPYLEGTTLGDYIRSAHYADEALGDFIELLKENNILENTVIILYGDHEARLPKNEFDLFFNYDPVTDSIKDINDPTYISMDNYNYDLLKNTPLIIWSNEEKYEKVVDYTMGMYDVLPTIANMFGFEEKYALGHDIFSSNEKIVIFPNGNVLTDKVYYSNLKDEYIVFENKIITSDYIDKIKEYSTEVLEVSNGIVTYNLIQNEEDKIGVCNHEKSY